jgi:hypothetical protein
MACDKHLVLISNNSVFALALLHEADALVACTWGRGRMAMPTRLSTEVAIKGFCASNPQVIKFCWFLLLSCVAALLPWLPIMALILLTNPGIVMNKVNCKNLLIVS